MFFLGVWPRGEFPPDFGDKRGASFPYNGAPVVNSGGEKTLVGIPPKVEVYQNTHMRRSPKKKS